MGRVLTWKPKPIHYAKLVRSDGAISPLCAKKPRALDLTESAWTIRKEAVTCKRCIRLLSQSNLPTTLNFSPLFLWDGHVMIWGSLAEAPGLQNTPDGEPPACNTPVWISY